MNFPKRCCFATLILAGTLFRLAAAEEAALSPLSVYVGTYTGQKSKGIYLFQFDRTKGTASEPVLAAEIASPSFLALSKEGKFLYSVNEIGNFQGKKSGGVSAFAVEADGKLKQLNQQPTEGGAPCHLAIDASGKWLVTANYSGGNVALFEIQSDGSVSPPKKVIQHQGKSVHPQRQEGPHAHCVTFDPANRNVFICDLGLDEVIGYAFDPATGSLEVKNPPLKLTPGAGPRHMAFHPSGERAYIINELNSTMVNCLYEQEKSLLTILESHSTLPASFHASNSTAEIAVHPSGKFVYGSNRGHDSIVVFRLDPASGAMRLMGHELTGGKTPRNFAIDPSGQFLLAANQGSDSITIFKIDGLTGKLRPAGTSVSAPTPVCVLFKP